VKARGVSSLVMKEVRMQALAQLTTTMLPEDWDYIPRREFLAEKFKAHDLQITLLTEEEVSKVRDERTQSQEMQLAIQMQQAEIGYKKAQTMAQLTKAKEHNVQAVKMAQEPPENTPEDDPRLTEADLALKESERIEEETETMRKNETHTADERRKEEQHQMSIQHQNEQNANKMAIESTRAAHEVAGKKQIAEHGMKMNEKMTDSAAKAKIIQAKHKPVAPKSAK
jgi:hypothetical protein